jgi:hypothetical protein
MNFEEAKMALRDGYIKAGLQLVDEHREELAFTFPGLQRNIYISEQEIKEYADFCISRRKVEHLRLGQPNAVREFIGG